MPKITKDTNYRTMGRMSYEMWAKQVHDAGGPEELASRGAWDACGDLSAPIAATFANDSNFQTKFHFNSIENKNPGNIRVRDRTNEDKPSGYLKFDSYVEACAATRGRINGEAGYFDGPNPYAVARTIEDLVETYSPRDTQGGQANDTDRLIAQMVANLRIYLPDWAGPVVPLDPTTGDLRFGLGVKPAAQWMPLNKEYGQGGQYRAPMKKIAVMSHETQLDVAGDGQDELNFWFNFFNCPNGERCADAACHAIVSTNGMAAWLIDPNGSFEPYVNGGLPAPSSPFNDAFGSGLRNAIAYGIENNKKKGGALSPGQIAWNAQLLAQVLDSNNVPWYQFPFYKGVSMQLVHRENAPTDCMIQASDRATIVMQAKVWGQKWQTNATDVPTVPPPGDPNKPVEIFPGLDVELAQRWFGKVVQDGRNYQLTWPLGPVAELWVANGKKTGSFAPLQSVEPYLDGRLYLRFADGFTTWRPSKDEAMRVLGG